MRYSVDTPWQNFRRLHASRISGRERPGTVYINCVVMLLRYYGGRYVNAQYACAVRSGAIALLS